MQHTAYQKVLDIHDQTIGMIRSLKVPPFPSQYQKYFDRLFSEIADEELRSVQQKFEYRTSGNANDDMNRYLELARRSIHSFAEAHTDISAIAQMHQSYIEQAPSNVLERCMSFLEGLNEMNLAISLELEKAQKQIDGLNRDLKDAITTAMTDPLTKVSNRQLFLDDLEKLIQMPQGVTNPISVLMIDADNFKFINEQHGHVAGDKILYFLAQSIKAEISEKNRIYRFSGGTFMVIMNDEGEKQNIKIAEKIRSSIEQTNLLSNGKTIRMTVSIGITSQKKEDKLDTILARVEKALYCAKKSNKNCVFQYDW